MLEVWIGFEKSRKHLGASCGERPLSAQMGGGWTARFVLIWNRQLPRWSKGRLSGASRCHVHPSGVSVGPARSARRCRGAAAAEAGGPTGAGVGATAPQPPLTGLPGSAKGSQHLAAVTGRAEHQPLACAPRRRRSDQPAHRLAPPEGLLHPLLHLKVQAPEPVRSRIPPPGLRGDLPAPPTASRRPELALLVAPAAGARRR